MKYSEMIKTHKPGEKACPICDSPLPEHQTWPGARYWTCGSLSCLEESKLSKKGRYIGPNEYRCEGPGCTNSVPSTLYDPIADFLACSAQCWKRRRTKGNRLMTCGCGCDQTFRGNGQRKPIDGRYFLSSEHYGRFRHKQYMAEAFGPFQPLANEYLDGFATLHYRDSRVACRMLGPFFQFLQQEGISSLRPVTPKIITKFLADSVKHDRKWLMGTIAWIKTFFNWAIAEGHFEMGNPVISRIHSPKAIWRDPRPLEAGELDLMWKLLNERGDAMLRLAASIELEAGLRVGEICRLRLTDLDLVSQRISVGTPNKTNRPRKAFFSDLTAKHYREWLEVRDPRCGHNYLLHNQAGRPMKVQTLITSFTRVLCKTYRGKQVNETGFDKWSTHRLRHTMASNLVSAGADAATIMAAGGWNSFAAMKGYARVDESVARRGYDEANRRARESAALPRKKTLSLSEFLDRKKKAS